MRQLVMHALRATACGTVLGLCTGQAQAIDFNTTVTSVKISVDGKMWVSFANDSAWAPYCQANGSQGLRTYVRKDHADFVYLYGLYMTALSKGRNVYISGVSGSGTTQCDLTAFDGSWLL